MIKKSDQAEILDPQYRWDEEESFEVQKILDETYIEGEKYYLVKWKGFDMAMNTWESYDRVKHLLKLLEEFKNRRKGKPTEISLRQKQSELINPYRATQIHGHFLYGDTPRQVKSMIVEYDEKKKKTIFLEIIWHTRHTPEGEIQLQNSIIESGIIFEHNPQFLIDYYTKSLALNLSH